MLNPVALDDKYALDEGRVYVTGTQALVRLPMLQIDRDRAAGLKVGGFISGYRGSPLGAYDSQLWRAQSYLKARDIVFNPGVNEDLAATSVWGSQQVGLFPGATHDGVIGVWYGKGPGVDRSVDVLRHANCAGTSQHGGVLMLVGDDHGAVSSSIAHQSEISLQAAGIPVLHPASIREYFDFGLVGYALSRFSGLWIGFKCLTETVESSGTVVLPDDGPPILFPAIEFPPDGVHIRIRDPYLEAERRLLDVKLPAAVAFARANRLDRPSFGSARPRFGIVTTGKSYGDVRQALQMLQLDADRCAALGIGVYKVAMVWPLEPEGVREFAAAAEELLVVEEKRPLIEPQVKEALYHMAADRRPRVTGKTDERGARLVNSGGELSPEEVAGAIAERLRRFGIETPPIAEDAAAVVARSATVARIPYFCSGCPHNSSTKVPEGSRAAGGIGCHSIALAVPGRNTSTLTQMGGEGAPWIGQSAFTSEKHIFQNLGDGTFFHSGHLAIRAAVAAKVNITFKILYNDAVAMTGGQSVDGHLTVPDIVLQMTAEGVTRTVIVTDEPEKYPDGAFKVPVEIFHRDELESVQRALRDTPGCTVLIYDQTCAAEKRRRRKRGTYPVSQTRAFINEAVCEGCGDCSVKSNCVSVEPLETPFGRKRTINQHSCNNDLSCVNGFCPSFVTITGGVLRKSASAAPKSAPASSTLPEPEAQSLDEPWSILVTGVGGTGVITIGALVGMAAHVEGLGVTVLDNTGLSQKNGAVTSHIRIARDAQDLNTVRIPAGGADLLLACDMVVAVDPQVRRRLASGASHAVVNSDVTPTAEFQWNRGADVRSAALQDQIRAACGHNLTDFIDATTLATRLTGDALASNIFLLGYALQRGLLPMSAAAVERAIELNGAAVEANQAALNWGRLAAYDLDAVRRAAAPPADSLPRAAPVTLEEITEHRAAHLAAYQDEAYARRYRDLVERAARAESQRTPGLSGFALAVAANAAKLMAYKDEYEVARLYTDGRFMADLMAQFETAPRISLHLAPPLLARRDPVTGEPRKRRFGPWMMRMLWLIARMKRLRGTALDPFGRTHERRVERALVADYFKRIELLCEGLNRENHAIAVRLASLPADMVGFGHVKERNIAAARVEESELLAAWPDGDRVLAPAA